MFNYKISNRDHVLQEKQINRNINKKTKKIHCHQNIRTQGMERKPHFGQCASINDLLKHRLSMSGQTRYFCLRLFYLMRGKIKLYHYLSLCVILVLKSMITSNIYKHYYGNIEALRHRQLVLTEY